MIDHHTRVVLGQISVDSKDSEIHRLIPLLDTLTGIDLAGVVITTDALHTHATTPPTCTPAARTGC